MKRARKRRHDKIAKCKAYDEALARFRQEFLHRYRFGSNKFDPHQGPQECARRRRQIAAGQLTIANGLAA